MRALIQRVKRASVDVADETIARIELGLLIFVGVTDTDTSSDVEYLENKIANLRIFPDHQGKMNRSLLDEGYSALVVSQFTLYGNVRKGRRPSFVRAARPEFAEPLVEELASRLERRGIHVERGEFGAEMAVQLVNDGPVTIWIDTAEIAS